MSALTIKPEESNSSVLSGALVPPTMCTQPLPLVPINGSVLSSTTCQNGRRGHSILAESL